MRLLVSEYVCGGACPEESVDSALLNEGRSMLLAVLRDAVRVPNLEVFTIWSARRERFPVEGVAFQLARSPAEELDLLAELAEWCGATLLIAPEFDGILTHRALLVEGVGGRLCGPNPLAITTCADKFELAGVLRSAGVPIIATHEFSPESCQASQIAFPAVIKPRDGAGSQETYLVRTPADFERLLPTWKQSSMLKKSIWQPYVAGRAVSVAILITPERYRYDTLPVCAQTLSDDERFAYQGGVVPARAVDATAIQGTAIAACRAVPGLRGYVGVDLIVPENASDAPIVVEINPRLTTSYLGYSRLCKQNLVEQWLNAEAQELTWRAETIAYSPGGDVMLSQ